MLNAECEPLSLYNVIPADIFVAQTRHFCFVCWKKGAREEERVDVRLMCCVRCVDGFSFWRQRLCCVKSIICRWRSQLEEKRKNTTLDQDGILMKALSFLPRSSESAKARKQGSELFLRPTNNILRGD